MLRSRAPGMGIILVGLLIVSAGRCQEKDPIRETLDAMVAAAEDRDAEAVMEHVANDFTSVTGGMTRDQATLALKRYFAGYEHIDISLSGVTIDRDSNAADASFRADFSGTPRKFGGLDQFLPRASAWQFDVELRLLDGDWKITAARWQQIPLVGN